MTALVTLDETKRSLRIDDHDEDDTIELLIEAASTAVLSYIKATESEVIDVGSPPVDSENMPRIRWAVIMLVGYWFRNRDADPDGDFERGYLPKPVTALLYDMRDPTVA